MAFNWGKIAEKALKSPLVQKYAAKMFDKLVVQASKSSTPDRNVAPQLKANKFMTNMINDFNKIYANRGNNRTAAATLGINMMKKSQNATKSR